MRGNITIYYLIHKHCALNHIVVGVRWIRTRGEVLQSAPGAGLSLLGHVYEPESPDIATATTPDDILQP